MCRTNDRGIDVCRTKNMGINVYRTEEERRINTFRTKERVINVCSYKKVDKGSTLLFMNCAETF